MELSAYNEALSKHDWRFEFSDDQEIWRAGRNKSEELKKISLLSRRHLLLWETWRNWDWNMLNSIQTEAVHTAKRDEMIKTLLAE